MTDQIVVIQPEVITVHTGSTVSTSDILAVVNSVSDLVRDADIARMATTDGTQTLTNKTIASSSFSGGTIVLPVASTPAQTAQGSAVVKSSTSEVTIGTGTGRKTLADTDSAQTLSNKRLAEYSEQTGTLSGDTPSVTAGMWIWSMPGASAPTVSISDGQSATLMIANPGGADVTWTGVTWIGQEPAPSSAGYTVVVFWRIGATTYGRY